MRRRVHRGIRIEAGFADRSIFQDRLQIRDLIFLLRRRKQQWFREAQSFDLIRQLLDAPLTKDHTAWVGVVFERVHFAGVLDLMWITKEKNYLT